MKILGAISVARIQTMYDALMPSVPALTPSNCRIIPIAQTSGKRIPRVIGDVTAPCGWALEVTSNRRDMLFVGMTYAKILETIRQNFGCVSYVDCTVVLHGKDYVTHQGQSFVDCCDLTIIHTSQDCTEPLYEEFS